MMRRIDDSDDDDGRTDLLLTIKYLNIFNIVLVEKKNYISLFYKNIHFCLTSSIEFHLKSLFKFFLMCGINFVEYERIKFITKFFSSRSQSSTSHSNKIKLNKSTTESEVMFYELGFNVL